MGLPRRSVRGDDRLRESMIRGGAFVPALWPVEVGNVLLHRNPSWANRRRRMVPDLREPLSVAQSKSILFPRPAHGAPRLCSPTTYSSSAASTPENERCARGDLGGSGGKCGRCRRPPARLPRWWSARQGLRQRGKAVRSEQSRGLQQCRATFPLVRARRSRPRLCSLWLEKDGASARPRLEGLAPVWSLMFGQMYEDTPLRNHTPSLGISRMGSRGRPIRLSAKSLRFGDLSLCHLSHYPPFQFVLRRYRVWRRWNHGLSPHCRSE